MFRQRRRSERHRGEETRDALVATDLFPVTRLCAGEGDEGRVGTRPKALAFTSLKAKQTKELIPRGFS